MTPRPGRAAGLVVAGMALAITPFVVPTAGAQDRELIGYLGVADSDAVTQTGGDPTQQGYPQVQAKTAHTYSSIDTGPNGLALASSEWPGELVGNSGSLLQVFGAPEEAGAANYPVRAEASTAGPAEASQPGMTARVKGGRAEAVATSGGFAGDGSEFLTFGDVQTVSRSELVDGVVIVTSTARVSDIDIGGVITIDQVETTAIVRSDGTAGSHEGWSKVTGFEVAGQAATVDQDGVHAGDGTSDNAADAVVQAVIEQVLSNFAEAFQVEVFMSRPQIRDEGNVQEYRSGALIIDMTLGNPEAGQGGYGLVAIGGSNAFAQATSGIPFSPAAAPPPETAPPAPEATSGGSTGFTPADPSSPSSTGAAPSSTTTENAPIESAAAPILDSIPIADRFSGLGFAMPFFVLLGGLVAGRGLTRFHLAVSNPSPAAACIIDGDRS